MVTILEFDWNCELWSVLKVMVDGDVVTDGRDRQVVMSLLPLFLCCTFWGFCCLEFEI